MKLSVKTFVQLFILGTCWTIVYALPFIQYILYDPLLEQLGCSNTQLGLLMTIFGLGNIFGAPVGGWLADRFDYKKIFVASIVLNGVLSIIFASHITYVTAVGIWLLMAVDVLVMNYPCHIKDDGSDLVWKSSICEMGEVYREMAGLAVDNRI